MLEIDSKNQGYAFDVRKVMNSRFDKITSYMSSLSSQGFLQACVQWGHPFFQ
jgi:hypothetical protein